LHHKFLALLPGNCLIFKNNLFLNWFYPSTSYNWDSFLCFVCFHFLFKKKMKKMKKKKWLMFYVGYLHAKEWEWSMDFTFNNYSNFSAPYASPSGRTLAPTNYRHNFYPHESCSYCFIPYYHVSDCLAFRQFSNLSCEQMNTNFSNLEFDSNFNFYNPDWSNHYDFSWQP
jgi:hypothetical protein